MLQSIWVAESRTQHSVTVPGVEGFGPSSGGVAGQCFLMGAMLVFLAMVMAKLMLYLYLLDVWGWGRGTTQAVTALGDRDG